MSPEGAREGAMSSESEDELWDRAEAIWERWRASEEAADPRGFDHLCSKHPQLASLLRRIRRQDVALARLAEEEGAASGHFATKDTDEVAPTQVDAPTPDAERRTHEIVDRLSGRETSFGKYHLAKRVGGGMSGAVFRVWDEDLDRPVALKLLHERYIDAKSPLRASDKSRARARFIDEARLTAQLDHPNIVPLHDFGITGNGRPYFTMKFVKGRTLTEIMEVRNDVTGPWTLTRTLGVFLKACEAVAYAHEKGVIHRDLKPSNIMVGRFGAVYVVDWGFVRRVGVEDSQVVNPRTVAMDLPKPAGADGVPLDPAMTREGDVIGTPLYMSPEQARGQNSRVGRPSDIYGLGAILYHLLAGTPPYQTGKRLLNGSEVVAAIISRPPDAIDAIAPRAPYELRRVVERAMAREVSDRYESVSEMSNDILAFIEGRVGRGWANRPFRSGLRWAKHRPVQAGLVALCALLVALLAARSFDRGSGSPRAEVAEGRRQLAEMALERLGEGESPELRALLEGVRAGDEHEIDALTSGEK